MQLQTKILAQTRPFRLSLKTDADEGSTGTIDVANTNEQSEVPGGIIGFSLDYTQVAC